MAHPTSTGAVPQHRAHRPESLQSILMGRPPHRQHLPTLALACVPPPRWPSPSTRPSPPNGECSQAMTTRRDRLARTAIRSSLVRPRCQMPAVTTLARSETTPANSKGRMLATTARWAEIPRSAQGRQSADCRRRLADTFRHSDPISNSLYHLIILQSVLRHAAVHGPLCGTCIVLYHA